MTIKMAEIIVNKFLAANIREEDFEKIKIFP